MRDGVIEPRPYFQVGQKFGFFVGKFLVREVGGSLRLHRPIAWILHRDGGCDDQHLVQADIFLCSQDHACNPWIERQPRELATSWRQRIVVIDRAEFLQQLVAIGDRAPRGRLDEGKRFDIGQMQRLHAQDHRCQRGTQDFRFGEFRPLEVILFLVEPNADTRRHPAATSGTLIRRRLRDRLDLQLLDLVAIAVTFDPRRAGVDHIADAGNRQRSLRHVGGQDDAPDRGCLEDPFLLLRRKSREQRQDLDMRRMMLAQRFGGIPDLALAGQEHEHVATTDTT